MIRKLILGLLFTFLGTIGSQGEAAFNLSGSTITQTGTDTDLSGLASIAGVNTITTGTGDNIYTVYEVGNRNLVINGTLTLNVQTEKIIFGTSAPFNSFLVNGTFNIEGRIISGGVTRDLSKEFANITRFTTSRSNVADAGLVVNNGGTLNWYGGGLRTSQSSYFQPGSNILLDFAEFNVQHAASTDFQIRSSSTNLTINNLVTNGTFILYRDPGQPIKNVRGIQNPFTVMTYGEPTGTSDLITYEDYQGEGNDADISFIDSSYTDMVNANNGSATKVGLFKNFSTGGTNRHRGLVKIYKDVQFNFQNALGNSIQDVRYFVRDTDNGNRSNTSFSNDLADNVYSGVSAASGLTTVDRLLLAVVNKTDNNYFHPLPSSYFDYRNKNGDDSDVFDLHFWHYNYLYGVTSPPLKGVGNLVLDWTLFDDTNISETNIATVQAYSALNSLEQLFDRAKAWKIELANIEYPTISTSVITTDGSTLNLGAQNLVVDGSAPSAFEINTGASTITINAGTMNCDSSRFKALQTTGTVTFINGAAPGTCIFTDSTGTNGVLTLRNLTNANILVFDDASATDDTISFQTDQNGNISIPFNATSSTDFQVVVRRVGYSEVNFDFNPSPGGFYEFPISQFRSLTIEGTPIYNDTGDETQISMDFVNQFINMGDFTVSAQAFYDTLQDYEVTEAGMKNPRIANYDGDNKVLLLNGYQMRNRDGVGTVPGVNGFIFTEVGSVLEASNGPVQYLVNDSATVDKQEQIIKMIEGVQGSAWDNNIEVYTEPLANLTNIAGSGFDPNTDSLSNLVQSMLNRGILDVNTMKDLVR